MGYQIAAKTDFVTISIASSSISTITKTVGSIATKDTTTTTPGMTTMGTVATMAQVIGDIGIADKFAMCKN